MSQWEILATDDPNKTLGRRHIEAVRKYFLDKGEKPRTCSVEGCYREVLVIKNPDGKTVEFDKCIFHVDKENEYWIENYYKDDYESYKKRRNEAIEKEQPFDEDFQIRWNEKLVAQFWELIREFKDIAFDESDTYRKWGILISIANSYNFSQFVFPKFENIETEYDDDTNDVDGGSSDSSDIESSLKKDSNFWTTSEGLIFKRQVYFENSTFIDEAKFNGIKFVEEATFSNSKFFNKIAFTKSFFERDLLFKESIFLNEADFENVKADEKPANFSESKFFNYLTFRNCEMNSNFSNCLFLGEANFNNSKFIRKADFSLATFKKKVNFRRAIFNVNKVTFNNAYFFEETDLDSLNFEGNNIEIDFSDMYSVYPISISLSIKGSGSLLFKVPSHYNLLILYNSNLSRFNNICFDGDVENVKFLNINWGKIDGKRFCKDEENRKKRDIFRQIKLALDKQENYIDARKFYALEMWAYGRELWEELKSHLNLKSSFLVLLFIILASIPFFLLHAPWGIIASSLVMGALALTSYKLINRFNFVKDAVRIWENFTEMIIYWFYQITSNFGLSWKRPILWLIIITPIYFELVNRKEQIRNAFERLSDFVPLLGKLLWQVFDNLNYISAKFLQSLSLFNSSTMQSNSNGIAFITLLYYSFSAYLIYQFVMAIRRKVRR